MITRSHLAQPPSAKALFALTVETFPVSFGLGLLAHPMLNLRS